MPIRSEHIILLHDRPAPSRSAAALRRQWSRGRLSFLPLAELSLLVIFGLSAALFFNVDTPRPDTPFSVTEFATPAKGVAPE